MQPHAQIAACACGVGTNMVAAKVKAAPAERRDDVMHRIVSISDVRLGVRLRIHRWSQSPQSGSTRAKIGSARACYSGRRSSGLYGGGSYAMTDREANRFSARAARYARVGANVGGVAARIAGARLFGLEA